MGHNATLLRRLKIGERRAFEELLDAYGPRVQKLARRYAASPADAEDLTQEIFVDLFKSVATFRGDSELSTWIYRVALNHCLRHKEKMVRHGERHDGATSADELELPSPDASTDPARRMAQTELSSQVHSALGDLSESHREIVVLHELHGLTYTQCAEILQIPVGTVKSRLSNAFSHLRRALHSYVLDESPESKRSTLPLAPEGGTP